MDTVDALVVGGGPAGAAFAITLAAEGRSVVILDRSAPPGPRSGDVLPPEIRPVLQHLGVWDRFRSDGHLATPSLCSAWGSAEAVSQDFIWGPYGEGWHVDRRRFDNTMLRVAEKNGADVRRSTRATRATPDLLGDERWYVDAMTDGRSLRFAAAFLIDASGRGSSLARLRSARRMIYDRLLGVVATMEPSVAGLSIDNRMLLEATENGWWYSAPVPGSRQVVGWMTDPDLTSMAAGGLLDLWHHELDRAPHTRARMSSAVARVGVVAANSCCRRAADGRWLAVGDAAAAYDPLSGQGVLRALETGQLAAAAVIAAQAGNTRALDDYADTLTLTFRRYLRLRSEYYCAERRWPDSLFGSAVILIRGSLTPL